MADENTGAALGYYPRLRRGQFRDDTAEMRRQSANAPLSALRGWTAGTLGLGGDIEGLLRMLTPGVSNQPRLPTSEQFKAALPLRSLQEGPTARAFQELGSAAGGAGLGAMGRTAGAGAGALGRLAAEGVARGVERGSPLFAAAAPAYVVKPKGGNWLSGSVERATEPLKTPISPTLREDMARAGHPVDEEALSGVQALNQWIDQKLGKYIKNEMATPEDPLRALAERGVSHMPLGDLELSAAWSPETMGARRKAVGFPQEGLASTEVGRGWELRADEALHNLPAEARLRTERLAVENPWLAKVPPETMTYGAYSDASRELGFTHLLDELRNATNPAAGLPANLQWKYGDLPKVTVPQAVQRVADINAWRAAQKAEADAAKAMNPATFTHKEYPDKGFKWVELKGRNPNEFEQSIAGLPPEEWQTAVQKFRGENESALKEALKYEGETMGHCVGGYCPDVMEGRSRIYSLRDVKGQPHVTIETRKQPQYDGRAEDVERVGKIENLMRNQGVPESKIDEALTSYIDEGVILEKYKSFFDEVMPPAERIVQIKGKANRAPNPEYLPFVQDFVKSGQWSDVGDLGNTGLRRTSDAFNEAEQAFLRSKGVELKPYIEPEETARYQELFKRAPDTEPGFAEGGVVSTDYSNQDYNPALVGYLVHDLKEQLNG